MKTNTQVGDIVKINDRYYKVAEIKMFPHGPMIGIYDEPPSKHIDYWNPENVIVVKNTKKMYFTSNNG